MAISAKQTVPGKLIIRDARPLSWRIAETISDPVVAASLFVTAGMCLVLINGFAEFSDLIVIIAAFYMRWLSKRDRKLPLKLPSHATWKTDPNNKKPGAGSGKPDGILVLGNEKDTGKELWLTNSDARTHILFLGTTGSGKTEGLKSLVTNALTWASGFIYVDGKADTDMWASLYALARRFGRDDDLLVLNYMTGNADGGAASNSLNPFSMGSASYLTNLMVGLMDEAGGDNAMWKGRAIGLMSALMPAMTWMRDNRGLLLDVTTIASFLELPGIIRLSRSKDLPPNITAGLQRYLKSLAGYVDEGFDDDGNEKPPAPEDPPRDLQVPRQQHGYLEMQFTRTLQSLGGDYGYIFSPQLCDIDMEDVVLNRRILVVLIPALEKSPDEAANLGKIVAAALKGMMGSTLGANLEGDWEGLIENKPTRAASPFITVFDEVGYYTSQGMAVMAAQARSLGFSLVFAAQDLPAMEKRVREEARSITANCNLKIFGKLEDPADTRDFFDKTIGKALIAASSGFSMNPTSLTRTYYDRNDISVSEVSKAMYADLKGQTEGEVHLSFGNEVVAAKLFYAAPDKVKAIRVQRLLGVKPQSRAPDPRDAVIGALAKRLADETWTAAAAAPKVATSDELKALTEGFALGRSTKSPLNLCGVLAVAGVCHRLNPELAKPPAQTSRILNAILPANSPIPPANAGGDALAAVEPVLENAGQMIGTLVEG